MYLENINEILRKSTGLLLPPRTVLFFRPHTLTHWRFHTSYLPTLCIMSISALTHFASLLSLRFILSQCSKSLILHTQQAPGAKHWWETAWKNGRTAGWRLEAVNGWKARSWTNYWKILSVPNMHCVCSHAVENSFTEHVQHIQLTTS